MGSKTEEWRLEAYEHQHQRRYDRIGGHRAIFNVVSRVATVCPLFAFGMAWRQKSKINGSNAWRQRRKNMAAANASAKRKRTARRVWREIIARWQSDVGGRK